MYPYKIREYPKVLHKRHKIIEDRKEYIEKLNMYREKQEQKGLEEMQRQHGIAEQKRLERKRQVHERKRSLNDEIQQGKHRHLKEKLHQIRQTGHGQTILKRLDKDESDFDIKKLDADQIAAKEAEELQKERRDELQAKLEFQEKKVDYFERAKRLEEIPLLQAKMKEIQLQEKERIAAAIEERKLAVATRDRLVRMKADKDEFLNKLKNERNIVYEDKLNEFEATLSEARIKRLLERKIARKEERRAKYLKEKQEESKRRQAERIRREKEEQQRIREEEKRKEREEIIERIRREEQRRNNKKREKRRFNKEKWPKKSKMTTDKYTKERR